MQRRALIIHETEIKQFGNRNGRNRVEIISTLGHKSQIVETDYEGRNELRGSKRITRIETNYEDRNELRGSKRIIKVEMDYVVRALTRSEERRVGKECRSRRSGYN